MEDDGGGGGGGSSSADAGAGAGGSCGGAAEAEAEGDLSRESEGMFMTSAIDGGERISPRNRKKMEG